MVRSGRVHDGGGWVGSREAVPRAVPVLLIVHKVGRCFCLSRPDWEMRTRTLVDRPSCTLEPERRVTYLLMNFDYS